MGGGAPPDPPMLRPWCSMQTCPELSNNIGMFLKMSDATTVPQLSGGFLLPHVKNP